MPDSLKFQLELVDKMSKPVEEASRQLADLRKQLENTDRATQKSESAFSGLSDVLANPMVAAIMAVVAAETALIATGIGMSIHANELKNDTLDALDAFLDTADASKEVYDKIEAMQNDVAISQERGMQLARALSAAGVTNKDALVDAIHSIGEVSSVLGEGAGSRIQSLIERSSASGKFQFSARQLKGTGVTESALAQALGLTPKQLDAQMKAGKITAERGIEALTKAVNAKFAGPASKQVLDIGNQFQHFKDNILKLFEDVDTGGFLKDLDSILKMFDQSTSSGKALKFVVTKIFDTMFKLLHAIAPYVQRFFLGLVVIGLKLYIAFKPLLKQLGMIGDQSEGADKLASAMSVVGDVLAYVASQIVFVVQTGMELLSWFSDVESGMWDMVTAAINVGSEIVKGLIGQLDPSKFVDAVKDMAQAGLNEFKSIFGIHSPSKVMAQMGGHLMAGLEHGIDKNSGAPADAMASAIPAPTARGGGSGGGGSVSVTVSPGAIVISGVQNAQQVAEIFPEMMADALEQLMIEKGVAA